MNSEALTPVFAGKAMGHGEDIVLFRSRDALHILCPDGEIRKVSPESQLRSWEDVDGTLIHLEVRSPEWTGHAMGNLTMLKKFKEQQDQAREVTIPDNIILGIN